MERQVNDVPVARQYRAMEMNDADDLLEQVMWLVSADITGLWEVVGIANDKFPERAASERLGLARRVVRRLFERGWVTLYEQHPDEVPDVGNVPLAAIPVQGDRVEPALADDINWDWSGVREAYIQYLIRVTPRGKREFHAQLRKEGKFR